jgi:hypothetical protein
MYMYTPHFTQLTSESYFADQRVEYMRIKLTTWLSDMVGASGGLRLVAQVFPRDMNLGPFPVWRDSFRTSASPCEKSARRWKSRWRTSRLHPSANYVIRRNLNPRDQNRYF